MTKPTFRYLKNAIKWIIPSKRIFGDIDEQQGMAIVDGFQEKSNQFDVLLLSPKAAGVGFTLTNPTVVIHFTRWWIQLLKTSIPIDLTGSVR